MARTDAEPRVLATSSQTLWYLTRGTGVISLGLLTVSVALGISEVVRFATPGWPRFVLAALHKNVALLATTFVAVHVLTALLDSFAHISIVDVLVPFIGSYRPLWLGLGAVAVDLLIAVVVTSLLRERVGYRAFRAVHWAVYACWPVALMHGLGTGTDTRFRWAVAFNVLCVALVVGAVLFRLGWTRTVSFGTRTLAGAGTVAVALAALGWMVVEPMRAGWARKAGTPSTLLASAQRVATRSALPSSLPVPFSSPAQGTITEAAGATAGRAVVTVDVVLAGARDAVLHLVIKGAPLEGGGVQMDSGTVALGFAGAAPIYQGQVTNLSGTDVTARARAADGSRLSLSMHFDVGESNAISGTVTAQRGGHNDN
jgi:sulfoxide reductase heme-binding subunit YedZ